MKKKLIISAVITCLYSQAALSNTYNSIISNEHNKYEIIKNIGVELKSCKDILDYNQSVGDGNYSIQINSEISIEVYCDMTTDGGGWTLVASNSKNSDLIAKGLGRNNASYRLDRTDGALGIPSPNSDFIIGQSITSMNWSESRITMFGFNDLTTSYNYPNNLGDYMDIKWLTNGNDATEKLDSITSVSNIEIINSNNFSIHSNTKYFILDAVRKDQSYNANSNQSTVGGAGVNNSNGDPSDGTYFGHGTNESNHSVEGAYIANGAHADSYGYVTWIR